MALIVGCAGVPGPWDAAQPRGPDAAAHTAQQPLPSGPMTRYLGNPLLRNGPESYDYGKTGPRVVLKEGRATYRIWYEAGGSDKITRVGYATSADGLQWTKRGTVISPSQAWEMEEVSPNSILLENGVYRMWYHGGGYLRNNKRFGNGRIGYATSSDGIVWTKFAGNPVLDIGSAGSFDDQQVAEPRVLKVGTSYRMYYTGQNTATKSTSLGMATSSDGITWTKLSATPILDTAAWGNFWGGAFFKENGIWHLWHAKTPSGLYYKWSPDGIAWTEGPSNPVLTTSSGPNAADTGLVGDSVSGYRDGNTYRVMYTGFNWNLFGRLGRFEGICLATIDNPNPPPPPPSPRTRTGTLFPMRGMQYFPNLNKKRTTNRTATVSRPPGGARLS